MSNLSKNTWTLNEWYQQAEAGDIDNTFPSNS